MKHVIVIILILHTIAGEPEEDKDATILKYDSNIQIPEKNKYTSAPENQIISEHTSKLIATDTGETIVKMEGVFSLHAPEDNSFYEVRYISDENGYRPRFSIRTPVAGLALVNPLRIEDSDTEEPKFIGKSNFPRPFVSQSNRAQVQGLFQNPYTKNSNSQSGERFSIQGPASFESANRKTPFLGSSNFPQRNNNFASPTFTDRTGFQRSDVANTRTSFLGSSNLPQNLNFGSSRFTERASFQRPDVENTRAQFSGSSNFPSQNSNFGSPKFTERNSFQRSDIANTRTPFSGFSNVPDVRSRNLQSPTFTENSNLNKFSSFNSERSRNFGAGNSGTPVSGFRGSTFGSSRFSEESSFKNPSSYGSTNSRGPGFANVPISTNSGFGSAKFSERPFFNNQGNSDIKRPSSNSFRTPSYTNSEVSKPSDRFGSLPRTFGTFSFQNRENFEGGSKIQSVKGSDEGVIQAQSAGSLSPAGKDDKHITKVEGVYSFVGADNIVYEVHYTSDERGYRPKITVKGPASETNTATISNSIQFQVAKSEENNFNQKPSTVSIIKPPVPELTTPIVQLRGNVYQQEISTIKPIPEPTTLSVFKSTESQNVKSRTNDVVEEPVTIAIKILPSESTKYSNPSSARPEITELKEYSPSEGPPKGSVATSPVETTTSSEPSSIPAVVVTKESFSEPEPTKAAVKEPNPELTPLTDSSSIQPAVQPKVSDSSTPPVVVKSKESFSEPELTKASVKEPNPKLTPFTDSSSIQPEVQPKVSDSSQEPTKVSIKIPTQELTTTSDSTSIINIIKSKEIESGQQPTEVLVTTPRAEITPFVASSTQSKVTELKSSTFEQESTTASVKIITTESGIPSDFANILSEFAELIRNDPGEALLETTTSSDSSSAQSKENYTTQEST